MNRILIPSTDIKGEKSLKQLERCLNSLRNYSSFFNISIAWDSCSPEFIEYFNKRYQIDENLINDKNRLNFSRNCNQGLRKARERKETVLLLNQDAALHSDQAQDINRVCSMVGITNLKCCDDPENIPEGSGEIEETNSKLAFFATIIHSDVLQKIGILNGAFKRGGFEDDDYQVRAKLAGFKTYVADRYVYHEGSYIDNSPGWTSASGSYNQEDLNVNLQKFLTLYQCPTDHAGAQEWILKNHTFSDEMVID